MSLLRPLIARDKVSLTISAVQLLEVETLEAASPC